MNTEQERELFHTFLGFAPARMEDGGYADPDVCEDWRVWQARAALQSQVKNDTTLFCDLKTDEEKSAFFLSGRGYETGVIAQAIQNDVAMAYHRCAEYKKELEALQSQDREDAERFRKIMNMTRAEREEVLFFAENIDVIRAIDHARRAEENK